MTQDLLDQLERGQPLDDEAAGVKRFRSSPDWIAATIDDGFYAFARLDGRWVATKEPLARDGRFELVEVFDASSLGQRRMGYVITSYDGGSEMGTERASLHVLCADADALRACGSIDIGHFVWALAAEQRRSYPGAATSLNARPHVEVRLKPTFEPLHRIRLAVAVDKPGSEDWAEAREDLDRIRANAGVWKIEGDTLTREP